MRRPFAAALAALSALTVTACGSHHDDSVVSAARGDTRTAEVDVQNGATSITIHAGPIGDDLYRVSTPEGAGIVPSVVHKGDRVQVSTAGNGKSGPAVLDVALAPSVRWRVRVDGGASDLVVDFHRGRLAAADVGGGDSRLVLNLPKPAGSVPIRLSAGISDLTVHVPDAVPARVAVGGGAGSLTIDGNARSGIAAGTVVTPPGWAGANNRYDVVVHAGVSTFTVDHR